MKKTLSAIATCFGLVSSAGYAADAYVLIGEQDIPLLHENISMEECKELGTTYAEKLTGQELTPVNVICDPSIKDSSKGSDVQQISYVCYRTKGPIVCLDR